MDTDALSLVIRDNGAGFDAASATLGRGLTNMRTRLSAVGGRLTVESWPGNCTRITAAIPVSTATRRAA
jgi:signal transduction histidine kinase